ncbi:GSCOCG00013410001-RA-CDS [Cotesia congregata]|nr:GSCOCG00013410001-RA-CDS [Cotesia congregata]
MNKVKRTCLSIYDRCKIVERLKAGESMNNLAREYKVTRQAICRIKHSETKLLQTKEVLTSCGGNLEKKKYKATEDGLLDRKIYEWFKQKRSMGFAVSGPMLKEKALLFNKRLGGKENFAANDGWLSRFKIRHGIGEKTIPGEKLTPNVETIEESNVKIKMENIGELTGIDLKYIYNCDESALYWKIMPTKTLIGPEGGRKKPKNRVTILFCTNATGTHKIPLFIIGKYAKPRCFKNVNHLPVHYANQVNVWMTYDLMKTWYSSVFLPEIKREHDLENNPHTKIILIMDYATCHPPAEELNQMCSSCSIMYLPPYVTTLIQPLNQRIIEKFKRSFRSMLLQRILAEDGLQGGEDHLKSLDLINCFNICLLAWNSISENDIKNSWKNFIPQETQDIFRVQLIEVSEFQTLLHKIPQFNDLSIDEITNWLNVDADDFGWQAYTNEDILLERQPDNHAIDIVEELDDEVHYKDLPSLPTNSILDDVCPTFIEALGGFKLFFRWFEKNGENPEKYQQLLQELHQDLLKKLVNDN